MALFAGDTGEKVVKHANGGVCTLKQMFSPLPPKGEGYEHIMKYWSPAAPAKAKGRAAVCFHYGPQKVIFSNWKIILS